jgi:short-subunit dehydrogenase
MASEGAHLVVSARRKELLESLADEIESGSGLRPTLVDVDLSRRGAAAKLAEVATEELGGVDVLVNNAGGGAGGSQWAIGDRAEAREAFEINYWSPLALTRAVVPGMRARGTGTVVNVSSAAPTMCWPGFGTYAATKAALSVSTDTLRNELTGSGVHVVEVMLGPVDTAVQGETRLIPGIDRMLDRSPMGDADTAALRILRGVKENRKRVTYPRFVALAALMPAISRAYSARAVAKVFDDLSREERDSFLQLVVRSGSLGDEIARQARKEWERARSREG